MNPSTDTFDAGPPATRPRLALGVLGALALLKVALHAAGITQYGYFRDELYYLASTDHLAWGYVEHPPLSIALLAIVRALLGDSLVALRLVPLLAGVATVVLIGTLARRLGGGRFAQGLAALGAVLAPVYLALGHYYSMNSLDLLLWTGAAHLTLTAIERGAIRDWCLLGLVIGLGLLNKISMMWFAGGLAIALLLTPNRRLLARPGPWLAALIALAIFTPHLVWQAANGWPTLEFMRNATTLKMVPVALPAFLLDQVRAMNHGSAILWILALAWGLGPAERSRGRVFAIIFLVTFLIVVANGRSRASYLAVAYPMLLAMGGVQAERLTEAARRRWLRVAMVSLVAGFGALALPFVIPLLPVGTFMNYQRALGMAPHSDERKTMGALPQQYADMFGWDELVALVARAYARLGPEERQHCRVFGQNYGEAGAVDVLGRKLGLPRAMSGHNSYWMWGPGDFDGSVLIIIGGDREDNARFFEDIEIVGQTASPWSMPYERGLDVSIARRPRAGLLQMWPRLRHYD